MFDGAAFGQTKRGKSKWWVLAAVLVPVLMGPIDASAVNVSFPTLAGVFEVSADLVGWVSMSYLLVTSCGMLSFGRLGDMFGFKSIFLTGIVVFTLGSAMCGASWSIGILIAFRALQAIGAGITGALAAGIITAAFPQEERGKALGMQGMAVALGLTVGPGLGGTLLTLWGWRAVFFMNLPIGLFAFWACRRLLPKTEKLKEQVFDWPGALLALVSLGCLLFLISRGQRYRWSGPVPVAAVLALATGTFFFWHQQQADEPVLHPRLFGNRVFAAGNGAALFHFVTQYAVVFVTSFLLQQVLNLPAAKAGVVMTAFPLTSLVVAPLSGALSDKTGSHILSSAGALLCTLGALSFLWGMADLTPARVAWRLSLFGLGTGMFQSPNNSAVMGGVPKERLGVAGAVLATARNVGMVLGIAVGSAMLVSRETVYLSLGSRFSLLKATGDVYLAAAVFSSLSIVGRLFAGAGQKAPREQTN